MLRLGPILGHTTPTTSMVWIRGTRPASDYLLIVRGVGRFRFAPTGEGAELYGTAIAQVSGLKPNWRYQYRITARGHECSGGRGEIRTPPSASSWLPHTVLFASCSANDDLGAWDLFDGMARDLEPAAVFFIGDQVYQDDARPETDGMPATGSNWRDYMNDRTLTGDSLRLRMAATYQHCWSRPQVRAALKRCPTYMLWDDHEIRDGWGSWASDSLTIAAMTPQAAELCAEDTAYYEAARDVTWHFQLCRNPNAYPRAGKKGASATATAMAGPAAFTTARTSFGYAVEIGRAAYLVIDGRGDRDLWRKTARALGGKQWACLEAYVDNLDPDIDAVAIVTGVPIAAMGPNGPIQSVFMGRVDEVRHVLAGDRARVRKIQHGETTFGDDLRAGLRGPFDIPAPLYARAPLTGFAHSVQLVSKDMDDARDQWAHEASRPEQARLLRLGARARTANRTAVHARSVLFVGGDLHAGGHGQVTVDGVVMPTLITSGIGKAGISALKSTVMIEPSFVVGPGITAHRTQVVNAFNFALVYFDPGLNKDRWTASLVTPAGESLPYIHETIMEGLRRRVRRPNGGSLLPVMPFE